MRKRYYTPYSENPKVRFWEILLEFNQSGMVFTAKDVAALFEIGYADARRRMAWLRTWGLVKVKVPAHTPKRCTKYRVSAWGKKYLKDQGHDISQENTSVDEIKQG